MIEVIRLDADDDAGVRAAYHLIQVAFGLSKDGVDGYRRQDVTTCGVLAARDGRELVGVATLRPYRQWFAGRELAMIGLGGVAVAAHARRRGVARTLLAAALEQSRADGAAVSVLFPSHPPVYRASGWEVAGAVTSVDLPTIGLPTIGSGPGGSADAAGGDVVLRSLDRDGPAEADLASVHALYTAAARPAVGPLTRTGPLFDLTRLRELDAVVLAAVDGTDAGYVSWSRCEGRLNVHDLVADRPSVRDALLGCVGSWQTTMATARLRLADPVLGAFGLPRGAMLWQEPWMLRVVNAEAAVAGRGFGPGETEVDLDLTDPQAPWQAGRWRFAVAGGVGRLTRGGGGAVRLRAGGLAAAFTGFAGASALVAAGLADGDEAALARLVASLAGPAPWMLDTY